jgi:hypothetical protein
MKKSTRRVWSQEDIDWLINEFHDWKKSYIQTNFSNATEEGIKKWIVRIPELFLKRCSTHLEKTTTAVKKKLLDLGLIVK